MRKLVDLTEGRGRSLGSVGVLLVFGIITPAGVAAADDVAHLAPVASLIDTVESGFGGRILMIELAQTPAAAGPARYDVKLLTDEGKVLRLHYDARTLELEAVEGRGGDNAVAQAEDEQEAEDEAKREDADEIEPEMDRDGGSDDNSGPGSGGDGGGDDSSGSGSSGSSGSGSSGSGGGSGSSGSGGGSDDGPDHN